MISLNRSGDSSLVRRIAAPPYLQDADEARARVNEWLAEIAGLTAGKTLTRLAAAHPRLEALMAGLARQYPADVTERIARRVPSRPLRPMD